MASSSIRSLVTPGIAALRGRAALQHSPRMLLRPTTIVNFRAYSVQNQTQTRQIPIPSSQQTSPSSSNGGDSKSNDGDANAEPQPGGAYARFKLLAKKYGWYAFGMYWILSTVDFTLTFMVVHGLGAERIEPVIESSLRKYRIWRHGEEETRALEEADKTRREEVKAEESKKKGGGGYWGSRMFWAEALLAYTIHKTALLPFRAGLTVAWTPKVVKWLRARGWAGKEGTSRALAHASSKLKRKAD